MPNVHNVTFGPSLVISWLVDVASWRHFVTLRAAPTLVTLLRCHCDITLSYSHWIIITIISNYIIRLLLFCYSVCLCSELITHRCLWRPVTASCLSTWVWLNTAIQPFKPASIHSFINELMNSFIHSLICQRGYDSTQQYNPSNLRPFIHSLMNELIHSFIHWYSHGCLCCWWFELRKLVTGLSFIKLAMLGPSAVSDCPAAADDDDNFYASQGVCLNYCYHIYQNSWNCTYEFYLFIQMFPSKM